MVPVDVKVEFLLLNRGVITFGTFEMFVTQMCSNVVGHMVASISPVVTVRTTVTGYLLVYSPDVLVQIGPRSKHLPTLHARKCLLFTRRTPFISTTLVVDEIF